MDLFFSRGCPEGAKYISPGQRPGNTQEDNRCNYQASEYTNSFCTETGRIVG